MPTLSDFGIAVNEAQMPFLRVRGKEQMIRIVKPLPVPESQGEDSDARIKTLARFEVEMQPSGERRIWDVSSKRLLSQLASLRDVSWPFTVARTGSGTNTVYEIVPAPEPTPPVEDLDASGA